MESLRSSAVAARAGVNVQTLRFYERRGLLQRPDRSPGGHRLYTDDDVAIVRAIKAAQRLGFTLDEVERLIKQGAHVHNDEALQEHAALKLAEIEARIADLHVVAEALAATIAAECDNLENCAAPRRAS
jgi:MerR family transcriptional regulator, mercuric resistance operon regulatory protein